MQTIRLDPPLLLITPKGKAEAYFLTTDHDRDSVFGCFQLEGEWAGTFWEWRNKDVRLAPCITHGRTTFRPFPNPTGQIPPEQP